MILDNENVPCYDQVKNVSDFNCGVQASSLLFVYIDPHGVKYVPKIKRRSN